MTSQQGGDYLIIFGDAILYGEIILWEGTQLNEEATRKRGSNT